MKYLKSIFIFIMVAILPLSFLACSKTDNSESEKVTKVFVGIAIYQKLDGNLSWSVYNEKPNSINNIISTQDNKITLDENPELLFYVYTQNEITTNTIDSDFLSNTTRDIVEIKDNSISFRIERIIEDTEILIYYIYKLEDNTFYLEYQDKKSGISEETKSFELNITHSIFSKIKLTLETNLTIKKEY